MPWWSLDHACLNTLAAINSGETEAGERGLTARLMSSLPEELAVGGGTAILVHGVCAHPARRLRRLALERGGVTVPVEHERVRETSAWQQADGRRTEAFWAIVPLPEELAGDEVELVLRAELDDGTAACATLARLRLRRSLPTGDGAVPPAAPAAVAICMPTYEPELELFARQVRSIRAQTTDEWICLVCDDRSSPQTFTGILEVIGDDPRFLVDRSPRRLGFYRNYERLLARVPPGIGLVALADQDDEWRPEKLERLIASMPGAMIAYSDARIVTADGRVRSPTYWTLRENNHTDLASMALANTVTGAAALYRRELIDLALPFPPAHGRFFHDHWLAFAGLALGRIAYIDRPLYDYVQHERSLLGHDRAHAWAHGRRPAAVRGRHFARDPEYFLDHWRGTYFLEYMRLRLFAQVLSMRVRTEMELGKRRTVDRLLADEHSPLVIGWLAGRALRGMIGSGATLGAEGRILRGLAWRRALALQARLGRACRWLPRTADPPSRHELERREA